MGANSDNLQTQLHFIICNRDSFTVKSGEGIVRHYSSLSELYEIFDKKVKAYTKDVISPFSGKKNFENVMRKGLKKAPDSYWLALIEIANEIEAWITKYENGQEENHPIDIETENKNNETTNNDIITFAFHSFPDTRLAYYFSYGLSNGLNLKFRNIPGWNSSINLFKESKINKIEENIIHLHSLSQAVILEKSLAKEIVFVPLFNFTGYGLMIKKSHLGRNVSMQKLLTIGDKWKEHLIEKDFEILVEKNSDFHFMLIRYFEKFIDNEQDLNKILRKIKSIDTHKGKDRFIKNNTALLYSTNWVHFESIKNIYSKEYHVIKKDHFYEHENLNGLIFLREFYEKNKFLIKKLIFNWYDCLNMLKREFSQEEDSESPSYITNSHIYNLCINLNEEYGVKLKPLDLKNRFETYNEFYKSLYESIESLKSLLLPENNRIITDYEKLAELNNIRINSKKLTIEREDIKTLISRSIKIISNIK